MRKKYKHFRFIFHRNRRENEKKRTYDSADKENSVEKLLAMKIAYTEAGSRLDLQRKKTKCENILENCALIQSHMLKTTRKFLFFFARRLKMRNINKF